MYSENYDTYNFSNITDIDSWIIIGLACLKMLSFFWPVVLMAVYCFIMEQRLEREQAARRLLMQPDLASVRSKDLQRRTKNIWK